MVELSSCLWIPEDDFSEALEASLTVKVYRLDGTFEKVECFRTDREGYVGLPRVYGMKLISNSDYVDLRSNGHAVKFPRQITLKDYQEPLVESMMSATQTRTDFITEAQPGKGKCLAKGTLVLLYDGRSIPVERVKVGDLLMGPDSTPRRVLSLAQGREEMFRVTPVKGTPYTVNRSHILSLKITNRGRAGRVTGGDGRMYTSGDIVDIGVEDYLKSSISFRHAVKGWRVGVEFASAEAGLPIPAYILGTWLGDGSSYHPTLFSDDSGVVEAWRLYARSIGMSLVEDRATTVGTYRITSGSSQTANPFVGALRELNVLRNKHVPHEYATASREDRLALLAGIVDTDGCVSCGCFDIVQKNSQVAQGVAFVARSLGFAAYVYPCVKRSQKGTSGDYWRVRVSGGISEVPCKVLRKRAEPRRQIKSVLLTSIAVESVGEGEFYGFTLDGDRRFLLGDFTVTHNTVCGLAVIQKLGRSAAVVVDQENLMDQWVDRCVEHLGMKKEDVGIVRGPRCEYKDKAITICMMQTLTRRRLPEEFYDAFGVVIFDECHVAGAPTFSRALMKFNAITRFGLSATPDRKDELKKVIAWNLGPVAARLEETPGRSSVYVKEAEGVYSWRVNNSKMVGGFINELADDGRRNLALVQAVKWLYDSGREVLVIGDRVEQLCSLMALAESSGVPKNDMGLYAKSRTVFRYKKDPRPPRIPEGIEKLAEYTPVRLALVQKTVPKKELLVVKERAIVIFATYGIMAKGVDIPRLSAGVDATPRSEATQVLGRILRTAPGKLRPIWVTIADVNSFRSMYQLSKRLSDYERSNAEVFLWEPTRGRKRLDVQEYRRELMDRVATLRLG